MSQKFGTSIDLRGNIIKNAGIEVVSSLPTDFLVEGREVIFQGEVLRYLNGKWKPNSFSAYTLKTYAELRGLKDSNALVTGSMYVLTDFYTTYLAEDGETWLGAPDCEVIDHLGNPIVSDNYHILLQATSENTFSPQVYLFNQSDSEKPYMRRLSEWIVYFDIDLDLFGRIIYMNDIKYNNTFDFDIFNIRWAWKGYQINLFMRTVDLDLIEGSIEPNSVYYLWTIGDLCGCFESVYSVYEIAKDLVELHKTGVIDVSIRQSQNVFLYVQATTNLVTSYNYYLSIMKNIEVTGCQYIGLGYESFENNLLDCSHIYLKSGVTRSTIYHTTNVISLSAYSRGFNISQLQENTPTKFLTFIFPRNAFNRFYISCARYSAFLSSFAAFSIIQNLDIIYPTLYRSCIISDNKNGTGGNNFNFLSNSVKNIELTIPETDSSYYIRSIDIDNTKLTIPANIHTLYLDETVIDINSDRDRQSVWLNYVNESNELVKTIIPNTEAITTVNVVFYERFLTSVNKCYFMPFVSFIENPTAWGYEIEGVKYPTHEDFPVLAGVFCNSGSNTLNFAKKTLKFYVETAGETFYSSEYMINQNNTLTLITQ